MENRTFLATPVATSPCLTVVIVIAGTSITVAVMASEETETGVWLLISGDIGA
jgi:hypothetical protein